MHFLDNVNDYHNYFDDDDRNGNIPLMVTGKNIVAHPKVPTTTIAFGRGVSVGRKKASIISQQQQSNLHTKTNRRPSAAPSSPSPSIIRRSGSVGQLNEGRKRASASGGTALSTSVFQTTVAAATTNGIRRCQCRNACKCVGPGGMAFLEGVYVQNLQTQIEVLELENAYLRGASDRGAFFSKVGANGLAERNDLEMKLKTQSATTNIPQQQQHFVRSQSAGIQTDILETTRRNGEEQHGGNYNFDHFGGGIIRQTTETKSIKRDKKVGFVGNDGGSIQRKLQQNSSDGKHQQRNVEFFSEMVEEEDDEEEGSGGYLYGTYKAQKQSSSSRELLKEREDLEEILAQEEKRMHSKEMELEQARAENEELERRLRTAESRNSGERRSLLAENVELQRRLDRLTPLLAEKENKMLKLKQELDTTNQQVKNQTKQIEMLQANLEEKSRENQLHDAERKRAEELLKTKIEVINRELETSRVRESSLEKDLNGAKARMHVKEAEWRKEEQERQRAMEELNEQLVGMNEALDKAGREKGQLEFELDEVRQRQELLHVELELARDKLAQEQDAHKEFGLKQKEWHLQEAEHRTALNRTQRELEALQSLTQSLANENKGLREEHMELEDRISELRNRLHTREARIHRVGELLNDFVEKYHLSSARLKQQLGRQSEECVEFDRIVHKMRQLISPGPISPSLPGSSAGILRPSNTTSSSNSPSQQSGSKTAKSSQTRSGGRTKTD